MSDHEFEESLVFRFVGGLDSGWRRGALADYAIALSELNEPVLVMRSIPDGRIHIGNEKIVSTARLDEVVRNFYHEEQAGLAFESSVPASPNLWRKMLKFKKTPSDG
jgi:hypothetical protein